MQKGSGTECQSLVWGSEVKYSTQPRPANSCAKKANSAEGGDMAV